MLARFSIYISGNVKKDRYLSVQTMLKTLVVTALFGLTASAQGCTVLCCNKVLYNSTPGAAGIVSSLGIPSPIYPIGVGCVPGLNYW